MTFEFVALIIFELLRAPVEMFVPPPLLVPLLLDELVPCEPVPEIVTFKNGLRNCQKNASAPFDCKNEKSNLLFLRLFQIFFLFSSVDSNNFNRYRVVTL